MRDDMAGRRGKCPKCDKPIDIPAGVSHAETPKAPVAVNPSTSSADSGSTNTLEQIKDAVREGLAALPTLAPGHASTAALVCKLTRGIHYFLPFLFGGLLTYHIFMNNSWASSAEGTPGALVYYVLLGVGTLLTTISVLSHIGPPRRKPRAGVPLDTKTAPLLSELLETLSSRLAAPASKTAAVWDATLHDDHGELRIGASALGNLSVAEVLGVAAREIAVYRDAGRCTARGEYHRLGRLLGDREPGETLSVGGEILAMIGTFGRPATWPLMVMVRSFAEGELRQAELEADAVACELVGSRAFLTTIQRRRLIDYAAELTQADLAYQFQDKSLPANRVTMVLDNMQTLPEEVQQSILETSVDDLRTGDYFPTWSERISAVQKLAAPGVLKCPVPARMLVANFEKLCQEVTWLDYSQRFGTKVRRRELK